MGTHLIRMPDIGEGIAEVELLEWHVALGEQVAEDQVLAQVMTDKATVEIPAPVAGKVIALGGEPGQMLAVGAELLRLEVAGAGNQAAVGQAAPAAPGEPPAPAVPASAAGTHSATRPLASPAVRQHARELGIDLRQVAGSGPDGRVLHADLPASGDPGRRIPLGGLRRQIARRMSESKRQIPHFSYVEEVDVSQLEALRQRLNQSGRHLTLLPFLVRALVLAAERVPRCNAHYLERQETIVEWPQVHLGIATQSEAGLLVPVLRDAGALDLWQSASEIERLARAARGGQASRAELSGSTITLSSLGALGGIASTPIINHPEVAIVGVNRIVERPVVRDGQVVVRKMMNLSSSFDHRVVDGHDAATFIQAMRTALEDAEKTFAE